jgi:hypothetical protein
MHRVERSAALQEFSLYNVMDITIFDWQVMLLVEFTESK